MRRRSTPRRHASRTGLSRALCSSFVAYALCHGVTVAWAHDLESTRVTIAFAKDGSFVIDVSNDPDWLKLRLDTVPGAFSDRVVLFVDGHEIRPTAVEYRPGVPSAAAALGYRPGVPSAAAALGWRPGPPLATHRLRGRVPLDAHTLRWYYGLVVDPYTLTIRRADGRVQIEEIAGDAWSSVIDLRGQFRTRRAPEGLTRLAVVGLLLIPLTLRFADLRRSSPGSIRPERTRLPV